MEGNPSVHILPNELLIKSLYQVDVGEYQCIAKNKEGSVAATTKMIVAGPATIINPPKNLTKLEGDKVEMTCKAKALPSNVTYRWFHNGIEISKFVVNQHILDWLPCPSGQLAWIANRAQVKKDGTLFIKESSAEDSGKYTCDAWNGIGEPDVATAYLSIECNWSVLFIIFESINLIYYYIADPARVTFSPAVQYMPLGLPGVVRCHVQASPPFQFITWTKDRRPFELSSNPDVQSLNNGSLFFKKVTHEHQGRYRCTPYNLHGTAGTSNVMEVLVRGNSSLYLTLYLTLLLIGIYLMNRSAVVYN